MKERVDRQPLVDHGDLPRPATSPSVVVLPNGFIDSYLVSFNGAVVRTGLTQKASEAYAAHLNEESRKAGAGYEAIVFPNRPNRKVVR